MDRLTDFSGKEEVWLRAFVTWVLARQCPLKRIEITFKPNPENSRWYEFGDLVYPWDRMDTVGAEVYRHYGEISVAEIWVASVTKLQFLWVR
jgi:hypothetical protein